MSEALRLLTGILEIGDFVRDGEARPLDGDTVELRSSAGIEASLWDLRCCPALV
jgi:hypothetical protein